MYLIDFLNRLKTKATFFALICLGFLPGAEVDICISIFPILKEKFNLSTFKVEYLLTFNLVFHLISAVFAGHFGDKYGRKKTTILGLMVFVFGCAMSCLPFFNFILFGRILQGIGSAFPMINSNLLVIETYKEKRKQTEMLMLLNGISIVGISVAPVIGSKLTQYFNWNSSFVFLFFFGLMTLFLTKKFITEDVLKEKKAKDLLDEFNFKKTFFNLHKLNSFFSKVKASLAFLKNKRTVLLLSYLTISACAYYVYLGMSSILYIEVFGVSIKHFGYFQGATAFVFGMISFLNSKIISRIGTKKTFQISVFLIFCFVSLEVLALVFNLKNPYLFCIMMLFSSAGVVFPINFMYSKLFSDIDQENRGKLSSVCLVIRWSSVSIFIQIAGYFYNNTIFSTIFINCSMTFISLLIFLFIFKKYKDIREDFGFKG